MDFNEGRYWCSRCTIWNSSDPAQRELEQRVVQQYQQNFIPMVKATVDAAWHTGHAAAEHDAQMHYQNVVIPKVQHIANQAYSMGEQQVALQADQHITNLQNQVANTYNNQQ